MYCNDIISLSWAVLQNRSIVSVKWCWEPTAKSNMHLWRRMQGIRLLTRKTKIRRGSIIWKIPSVYRNSHIAVLDRLICRFYNFASFQHACEVKWALGSIIMNKANEHDGILDELFQILKDDVVKVLHSICQQIWKTQQWPQDWKSSVFIPIPKKGNDKRMLKLLHNCTHLIYTSKVMLKILQTSL